MNNRMFINCVKVGVTAGGMACGPACGKVIVSVEYKRNGAKKWFTIVEVEGVPNSYITEDDIFEKFFEDAYSEELTELLLNSYVKKFCGIDTTSYEAMQAAIEKNPNGIAESFLDYVVKVTRGNAEETERLIHAGEGKYGDEIVY